MGNVNIFHDALSFNTKEGGSNGGLSIHANGAGGGGGLTEVCSWTFTGNDNVSQELDIGPKFPIRNFMIYTYADTDTNFAYNSTKKFACGIYFCPGEIIQFAETDYPVGDNVARQWVKAPAYDWTYTSTGTYPMNGTPYLSCNAMASSGTFNSAAYTSTVRFTLYENDTTKVKLWLGASTSSSNGKFYSGVNYNCKLYYFGSDPANDFITI